MVHVDLGKVRRVKVRLIDELLAMFGGRSQLVVNASGQIRTIQGGGCQRGRERELKKLKEMDISQ